MSSCVACKARQGCIAANPGVRLHTLCVRHQQPQHWRPKVTVTLSKESREALRAMKTEDGLSTSRCVDLLIRAEWRRRQHPPGWGS